MAGVIPKTVCSGQHNISSINCEKFALKISQDYHIKITFRAVDRGYLLTFMILSSNDSTTIAFAMLLRNDSTTITFTMEWSSQCYPRFCHILLPPPLPSLCCRIEWSHHYYLRAICPRNDSITNSGEGIGRDIILWEHRECKDGGTSLVTKSRRLRQWNHSLRVCRSGGTILWQHREG